ncbi:MAG: hypothetical protein ACJ8C4_18585 [Gemmataceae bacterium]
MAKKKATKKSDPVQAIADSMPSNGAAAIRKVFENAGQDVPNNDVITAVKENYKFTVGASQVSQERKKQSWYSKASRKRTAKRGGPDPVGVKRTGKPSANGRGGLDPVGIYKALGSLRDLIPALGGADAAKKAIDFLTVEA